MGRGAEMAGMRRARTRRTENMGAKCMMTDSNSDVATSERPAGLSPTPSDDACPRRFADFATLGEALDYAAQGTKGLNFHDPRGTLTRAYTFTELRDDALAMTRRLIAAGIKPEDRVALI